MKIYFKKHLSLLLAVLLIISTVFLGILAFAEDEIEINAENFPDDNFRNAVAFMYDTNGDGFLSKSERNLDSMIVSGIIEMYAFEHDLDEDSLKINNLKGIEFFESLKSLRCSSIGHIEQLDVSSLDKLETLACNDLGLTSIDLSGNKALKTLYLCSNEITQLDLTQNTALTKLHCYSNDYLSELNINGLINLEELRCDYCNLNSLDLLTNTKLRYLICSYNHLTNLDLSNNTLLVSDSRDITEYNIGHQTSSAFVTAKDGLIVVQTDLDETKIVSTSLDTDETVAFASGYFYTDDFANMSDGIDYLYNTGVSDYANMSVHLDVSENEHYYELSGFDFDENCADISCVICKDCYKFSFTDAINARIGSDNYNAHLDVTGDGIINAKDFAKILMLYNE